MGCFLKLFIVSLGFAKYFCNIGIIIDSLLDLTNLCRDFSLDEDGNKTLFVVTSAAGVVCRI